jgi:hypothetical protein
MLLPARRTAEILALLGACGGSSPAATPDAAPTPLPGGVTGDGHTQIDRRSVLARADRMKRPRRAADRPPGR